MFIAGEMRHQSELNLRIIGREEKATGVGHHRLTNELASFASDGQILQVGVRRRQSSGSRYRLIIRGMYLARLGVDQERKGVDIRREQFLQLAVFEDHPYDGVFAF